MAKVFSDLERSGCRMVHRQGIINTEIVGKPWSSTSSTSTLGKHLTRDKIFTCKQLHHRLSYSYQNHKVIKEKLKFRMKFQESFYWDKVKSRLNMIVLEEP